MLDPGGMHTPPTRAGELAAPMRPTVWPSVVGSIALAMACLSLLGAVLGIAGPLLVEWFARTFPQIQAQFAGVKQYGPEAIALAAVGLAVALLLVATSVGILRRRPWAAGTAITWAVLKIALEAAGSVVGYLVQQAQAEAVRAQPGMGALPAAVMKALANVGVVIGFMISTAFAWFILCWFLRPTIRAQTAAWRNTPAS